jgi:hypothetical protein
MNKNNTFKNNTFLIVILVIIAILLFINIFLYFFKINYESFDNDISKSNQTNTSNNINLGINFQTGISNIDPIGSIIFETPFTKPPVVFTQIVGNTGSVSNIYSVQIFDVTNTGFNYSKNKVYNNVQTLPESSDEAYIVPKIDKSLTETFLWMAFR